MKMTRTKRSLMWGVLLTGVAGTLTGATGAVHAETVMSSAAGDESGSATVKPYIWTNTTAEMVRQAEQRQALYGIACIVVPTTFGTLSARALD